MEVGGQRLTVCARVNLNREKPQPVVAATVEGGHCVLILPALCEASEAPNGRLTSHRISCTCADI